MSTQFNTNRESGSDGNVLTLFKNITTFVFDVDGVLTDGTVLLLEGGLQVRRMHTKDGLALQMALKAGYKVVVISGAYSEPVLKRLQYLGLQDIFLATNGKKGLLEKWCTEQSVAWEQLLYMGDDLPDVPVLQQVGLATCPADAVPEVKEECHYISRLKGGEGCVRDVIEKVLKLAGKWHYQTEIVSK